MNIIKLQNVSSIVGFNNKLEVNTNFRFSEKTTDKYSILVVLSDDDINNDNCLIKLRGYDIASLLIPKKYRFTFFDMSIGNLIQMQLAKNYVISYY